MKERAAEEHQMDDEYDSKKLPPEAKSSPAMFMYYRSIRLREKELKQQKLKKPVDK